MRITPTRTWLILAAALCAALSLAGCGGSGGGGGSSTTTTTAPPPPTSAYVDSVMYSSAPGDSLASAAEITAVTHAQIVINGATLNYTATAGHLTALGLTSNAPEASFFYIAYTLDGANPATRPVTFFYNGGPGSSTVWLHLGSFGPKRLVTGIPATTAAMPFPLVDNADSLLDVTDMVFIDAVGTGFSEAIAPNTNQSFWGVDADAGVFRDFVIRYLAVNTRNASPKFLFGESYGTTRSAVLANVLETAGVDLNGVVLQSSIMNYNSNCGVVTAVNCAGYLPTYGAVGSWFNLLNPNPPSLTAFVAQMRTFAASQYALAVSAYLQSLTPPSPTLLTQLANTTGIVVGDWQAQFNLGPDFFQYNLIPNTVTGRYDARVTAIIGTELASEGDPSSTFITPSFTSAISTYLSTTLQYTNPSSYVVSGNAINSWVFTHDGLGLPDTIPDLAAALAQNPKLQVLSLNGYDDLATPFFQTEEDLSRLGANPNVQTQFFVGGHMIYLDDTSRPLEKAAVVQLIQRAATAQ
jgi:carboxypeptidase C (cathepsin A)